MAVQKSKVTSSRRGMRRSHDALKGNAFQECPDTGNLKRPHHISPDGWYKGRQVIKPKQKQTEESAA